MNNIKTLKELEIAQNKTIQEFGFTKSRFSGGIMGNRIYLQDSLPWLEVQGNMSIQEAQVFAQTLSNTMNINILLNRLETDNTGDSVLYLVLDIDPKRVQENYPVPAYSEDKKCAEYMKQYGNIFYPKEVRKLKIL